METGYIGGILPSTSILDKPWIRHADWRWSGPRHELFLFGRGNGSHLRQWGSLALLIRGHVSDPDVIAEGIRAHYQRHGELPCDRTEGSYSLLLMDGERERCLLFRNLVGNSQTYYTASSQGAFFGSNLSWLMTSELIHTELNAELLPVYFLHRHLPGRDTLTKNCYRLLPGEEVELGEGNLQRRQRVTFEDLREEPTRGDALERLESLMEDIFEEHAREHPRTANMLSGGVDSSYLQAHWNRVDPDQGNRPLSFCAHVDHPRSLPDTEYAISAAKILGTEHILAHDERPYLDSLIDTISLTGEPPNHVQNVYFPALARTMRGYDITHALCGETADSLLGTWQTPSIQMAMMIRKCLPTRWLRTLGRSMSGLIPRPWARNMFLLAEHLYEEDHPIHPINEIAVYTDRAMIEACFGPQAFREAAGRRLAMIDDLRPPKHPLERLHAAGFLGSAINTAAYKNVIFNAVGIDLLCPFVDSRMLRLLINLPHRERFPFRKPKELFKRALARRASHELAYRSKLSFGQPIFEWLSPGGPLYERAQEIDGERWLPREQVARVKAAASWPLYSLLCLDVWAGLFPGRAHPDRKLLPSFLTDENHHGTPDLRRSDALGAIPRAPQGTV